MADTMLERMAAAIYREFENRPLYARSQMNGHIATDLARAALEAIRVKFGDLPQITTDYAATLTAFNTVIAAILSEDPSNG